MAEPAPAARMTVTDGTTTTDSSSRSSFHASQTDCIRCCSASNRCCRAESSRSDNTPVCVAIVLDQLSRSCLVPASLWSVTSLMSNTRTGTAQTLEVKFVDLLARATGSAAWKTRCEASTCHGRAVSHSRAARLVTLPIAA